MAEGISSIKLTICVIIAIIILNFIACENVKVPKRIDNRTKEQKIQDSIKEKKSSDDLLYYMLLAG